MTLLRGAIYSDLKSAINSNAVRLCAALVVSFPIFARESSTRQVISVTVQGPITREKLIMASIRGSYEKLLS